jgi:hypothetical protein
MTQDWEYMQLVEWSNPPQETLFGYFNPSFSQSDSLLYFDTFFRFFQDEPTLIYSTHIDSVNQYNQLCWSDPVQLPVQINFPGVINAMPSINHSGDTLFFCSDRSGSFGGLDIWMSIKENNEWTQPINLGDSINTTADEFSPCYSSMNGILFFDSYRYPFGGQIYYSVNLSGNFWSLPQRLPENINLPDHYSYGPFFDDNEQALYFTTLNFEFTPDPLLRANSLNGNWSDPVALNDNVNGFWTTNPCNLVTTENASTSLDNDLLFYNKHIWEVSACIDFFSYIFYSKAQTVNTEFSMANEKRNNIIEVYPNPSNDRFIFKFPIAHSLHFLRIYDIRGRFVLEIDSNQPFFIWGCRDFRGNPISSGVYFAVIQGERNLIIKKLTYIK